MDYILGLPNWLKELRLFNDRNNIFMDVKNKQIFIGSINYIDNMFVFKPDNTIICKDYIALLEINKDFAKLFSNTFIIILSKKDFKLIDFLQKHNNNIIIRYLPELLDFTVPILELTDMQYISEIRAIVLYIPNIDVNYIYNKSVELLITNDYNYNAFNIEELTNIKGLSVNLFNVCNNKNEILLIIEKFNFNTNYCLISINRECRYFNESLDNIKFINTITDLHNILLTFNKTSI